MNRNPDNWQWLQVLGTGAASRESETSTVRMAGEQKVPPRPGDPTAEEVERAMRRLCQSDRRTEFARSVFPFDPTKYRSESDWRKKVGTRVSNDIHSHPELKRAMYDSGYRPHVTGYTDRQLRILLRFYLLQGVI